jgi:GGDEF domain-containing protein
MRSAAASGDGPTLAASVSVGVALVVQNESLEEDFLFNEANRAMYYARQAGRNRLYHVDQLIDKPA